MVAPPALVRATVAQTTADTYARDMADFARLAGPGTILDDLSADDVDDLVPVPRRNLVTIASSRVSSWI